MKRKTFIHSLALLAVLPFISCSKPASGGKLTIGLLPKSKGNSYFVVCERGAREAAAELNAELVYDGPEHSDPAKQTAIVEKWIADGVDVIVASCEDRDGLSSVLRKARAAGVKVVTFDSDSQPDARSFFVNQVTPQDVGDQLMNTAGKLTGGEGEFAIITGTPTAANQNEWIRFIKEKQAAAFPNMKLVDIKHCDDLQDKARQEAANLLAAHPNLKAIVAVCSPAVPGAGEAVKQAGKAGQVKVVGLGLPEENKAGVKEGVIQAVVMWNAEDLGYLSVMAGASLASGPLAQGVAEFNCGKLGDKAVKGDVIFLGKPYVFTKENIDDFQF